MGTLKASVFNINQPDFLPLVYRTLCARLCACARMQVHGSFTLQKTNDY